MTRELITSIEMLSERVLELAKRDRFRAIVIKVLAVSVAFDLLLSGLFFYDLHRQNGVITENHRLILQVQRNSATLQANCVAFNTFSKKNRVLWTGLFDTVQHSTAKLPQPVVDAVAKQLDDTFVQTDCSK